MATPWYTSQDLINSVKRKIAFPISQNTFLELDILAFANEEMFISQVPSVLQFHEEYFVHYTTTPLQTNVSRYPIPDRATAMKLRDLFWQDQNGNLFEMTRIEEHDKAFYQRNVGANQAVHKFYVEGNDVILTPGVVDSPTGSLVFVFYLRPNQLVKNDRVATVQGFNQTIKINNSLIAPLDTINLAINERLVNPSNTNYNPPTVTLGSNFNTPIQTFTAVSSLGGTISSITQYSGNQTLITTSSNHQLTSGQTVIIVGSNSNPIVDGTYPIQVISPTSFLISNYVVVDGTAGSFTSPNQFLIDVSDNATASNLIGAINSSNVIIGASVAANIVTLNFSNIYTVITTNNQGGFLIPTNTIGVQFTTLPSSYTDIETNVTETLFVNNTIVDFLKTKPGHNTYIYDVQIPNNGITGTSIYFQISQLLVPTNTVNNSGGSTGASGDDAVQYVLAPLVVGDYMSLANECIIPQIPPDLHNGLAERTASRILAALGDQAGLAASNAKIAEIDTKQGNLLNNRSEGNPQKVVARHSMLRYYKMGVLRRT